MPRFVANQRERFDNDELFRKLSRDMEIRYTGFRDRPSSERRLCLQAECREGHASVAIVGIGLNLNLNFSSNSWRELDSSMHDGRPSLNYVDFEREPNKVHLKSRFILNGVCVMWRGWLDLRRLDGVGRLEFDAEAAELEEIALRGSAFHQAIDDQSNVGLQFNTAHQRALNNERHRSNSLIRNEQVQSSMDIAAHGRLPPSSSSSSSVTDGRYVTCYDDVSN